MIYHLTLFVSITVLLPMTGLYAIFVLFIIK